jgi:hypothetical protein
MLLRRVVGVGDRGGGAFRLPLLGTGRARRQLPFVLEQVVEEVVAPPGRRLRPGDFGTAGDGIGAPARAVLAFPAKPLVLDRTAFRLRSDQRRIAGTVRLAESVAARDQRDRLLIVHRHAGEGLADIPRRRDRVGIAVRALGIDVDQAHLHGAERIGELAFAAVALIAQPRAFRTPVKLFGFPGVGAAAGKAEGLESHRLERDVAGQHVEVGPRNLAAVLLFDRPQETARLVEIGVVRPAVERREALLSAAGATAAIGDTVGAGAMPGHAYEQAAIVAEVGRPPVLRIRHQRLQVLDHGVEIETLELLGVVERRAHRVGPQRVLTQTPEIELVRPPVAVGVGVGDAREGALALVWHGSLRSLSASRNVRTQPRRYNSGMTCGVP